ncbi:Uncharacterized conserved protein YndB, AHSA1/START domain [Mucilaginibacter pineti]|uniref:Uncharacterized conserved protein YndB, AHSA1/START domain n=2 Tax=Mucilaginibacter pineti TaxID=1391627 RepID=A0A1G6ZA17_9SPHI|nr:Uncharacterized conserved protein YndB, AHSA1/START domain [Mucilaginibacter pineti]
MDTPFVLELIYNAPIEKVWLALTNENSMREWYFPQLKKFEPVVGFNFEFINDGSPFQKEWRVTQVIREKLLAHSWTYIGYPGYSEVIFEITEEGNQTKLKLTHTGLSSFPTDPHFARKRFEDGWVEILGNKLRHFLEHH